MSENLAKLCEMAVQTVVEQTKKIMAAPADSQVVKANQHLLDLGDFGVGAGLLSCAGALYYVLDCTLAVTGTYACAVSFNASGFSWDFGAFTAPVAGTFLVNPNTIAGKCRFTCIAVDVGEGMATFTLFGTDGELYGTFVGLTEGGDVADISGTGTLSVS